MSNEHEFFRHTGHNYKSYAFIYLMIICYVRYITDIINSLDKNIIRKLHIYRRDRRRKSSQKKMESKYYRLVFFANFLAGLVNFMI